MRRPSPRPSSTWRTFPEAHIRDIVAVDFFVVPTHTFRVLLGFLILRHDRRELVHVNVTDHPTAAWAAHQLVESFPEETAPKYLLRDRDAVYVLVRRVKGLGIREILIAPQAPGQNPFAERVIGSIRRECLDLVIVINEQHLRRLAYYNTSRPHQSLDNHSPHPREVQTPAGGRIVASRRSADFITAISALPECRGIQRSPTTASCSPPSGCSSPATAPGAVTGGSGC
jgi:putative transposase